LALTKHFYPQNQGTTCALHTGGLGKSACAKHRSSNIARETGESQYMGTVPVLFNYLYSHSLRFPVIIMNPLL